MHDAFIAGRRPDNSPRGCRSPFSHGGTNSGLTDILEQRDRTSASLCSDPDNSVSALMLPRLLSVVQDAPAHTTRKMHASRKGREAAISQFSSGQAGAKGGERKPLSAYRDCRLENSVVPGYLAADTFDGAPQAHSVIEHPTWFELCYVVMNRTLDKLTDHKSGHPEVGRLSSRRLRHSEQNDAAGEACCPCRRRSRPRILTHGSRCLIEQPGNRS